MYWIILACVLWGIIWYDSDSNTRGSNLLYYFILVLVIFASTFAYELGNDAPRYQVVFESELPNLSHFKNEFRTLIQLRWQIGFAFFASVCKTIIPSFYFFKLVYASIINITVFHFFRRYSDHVYICLLFYLVLQGFYFNFEIFREALAVSVFLWAYPCIVQKKWLRYYLLCALALLFHTSALITLFVPLILFLKVGSRWTTIIMFVLIGVLIAISSQMTSVVNDVMVLDESIESSYSSYLDSDFYSSNNFSLSNITSLATLLLDVILPIIMLYLMPRRGLEKDYFPIIFIVILLVIPAKSFLILFRFSNYFMVFKILFYIEMFKYLSNVFFRRQFYLPLVLVCLLYVGYFFYSKNYQSDLYGLRGIDSYYPYVSIFQSQH